MVKLNCKLGPQIGVRTNGAAVISWSQKSGLCLHVVRSQTKIQIGFHVEYYIDRMGTALCMSIAKRVDMQESLQFL